jgi:dienelactone hydrolase
MRERAVDKGRMEQRAVQLSIGAVTLEGYLHIPPKARGMVIFAHGSGSSRNSPRNLYVARALNKAGLATLLPDLLTAKEEAEDDLTARLRFDISLLASRLVGATDWLSKNASTMNFNVGYFGASTGAAVAIVAAAERPKIKAIVSRGGRPDLAKSALSLVKAPTLLIVGGEDDVVIGLNQRAYDQLGAEKELVVIPGATHLFEEPGTLEEVAQLASNWFTKHFGG